MMKNETCDHQWLIASESCNCSVYDSRGSGQYNDPCYGAACPCEGYTCTTIYKCQLCGKEEKQ